VTESLSVFFIRALSEDFAVLVACGREPSGLLEEKDGRVVETDIVSVARP